MAGSSPAASVGHRALPKPTWSTDKNVWAMVVPGGLCCTCCGDTGTVTPPSLETGAM